MNQNEGDKKSYNEVVKINNNIELTSAEFLQLLANVQRSPIPEFSIDFFDQPVALDDIQLNRMYFHIVRIILFIHSNTSSFIPE